MENSDAQRKPVIQLHPAPTTPAGHDSVRKKSATALLLGKTYQEVWHRGEAYANGQHVAIDQLNDRLVEARVAGTKQYGVSLAFSGLGLRRRCSCPYADGGGSPRPVCKHMVAVAILWDEQRGLTRPSNATIATLAIAPPPVSRTEINKLFKDPLHADLDCLRMLPEARGSWSRPHSQLPHMPRLDLNPAHPLTPEQVRRAFGEIARWANRRTYDPYFCAGEMTAAFCAVLRVIRQRLAAISVLAGTTILLDAQQFHYTLVQELIDDSDGHHVFNEAHLEALYAGLRGMAPSGTEKLACEDNLRQFEIHREDY